MVVTCSGGELSRRYALTPMGAVRGTERGILGTERGILGTERGIRGTERGNSAIRRKAMLREQGTGSLRPWVETSLPYPAAAIACY
eukprot:1328755-Rhodomonas_salina.4